MAYVMMLNLSQPKSWLEYQGSFTLAGHEFNFECKFPEKPVSADDYELIVEYRDQEILVPKNLHAYCLKQ
jgi:hypothetical protein